MNRKRIMYIVIGIIVALGLLWTVAAMKAGLFITDRHAAASNPQEESMEAFSKNKKFIDVDSWRVAYVDEGNGEPVLLLHGRPFHSFEWRDVIPLLTPRYRVIAPDLLELGDTVARLDCQCRKSRRRMLKRFCDSSGRGRQINVIKTSEHYDR